MRGLISFLLLIVSSDAVADPATLITIGSFLAAAGTEYIVYGIGLMVIGTVWGQDQAKREAARRERDSKAAYNNSLRDRASTVVATDMPYTYVYGEARVGSAIVAVLTSGDRDEYKHLVCVHAAHECESIDEVYVNGKALGTLDGSGFVTSGDFFETRTETITETFLTQSFTITHTPIPGSVSVQGINNGTDSTLVDTAFTISGLNITANDLYDNYKCTYQYVVNLPRIRVKKYLGSVGQTADVDTINETANSELKWLATSTLDGKCYTIIRIDLNSSELQSGVPAIEVKLKGKKLYDVRTSTTSYSNNNALAIYDYLTSEICGVDPTDIPTAEFITAANVCDETKLTGCTYSQTGTTVTITKNSHGRTAGSWFDVTYLTGTGTSGNYKISSVTLNEIIYTAPDSKTTSGNATIHGLYTINGTVTSDQSPAQVLEKMAQSMAGTIVSTTWNVSAGKYVAPVMSLNQSDIVGDLNFIAGISEAELYNGIKGQYISSANLYVPTDYEPYRNSAYAIADGKDLWSNNDFMFTDTKQRVWNLCRIFTEDQRNGVTIKAAFSHKCWDLQVGQRVTFTSAFLGMTNKVFRVVNKVYAANSAIDLTLKEDAASIWDLEDAVTADPLTISDYPNPFIIEKISGVNCQSGTDILLIGSDGTVTSRILVSWNQTTSPNIFANGEIEVEWQKIGTDVWSKTVVTGYETQAYIPNVEDGSFYTVRVRASDIYLNAKSDWSYSLVHQVIGKTAPPPNITSLTIDGSVLNWIQVTALDLDGYVFKFNYGSNIDWGIATPLHTGIIKSAPYDLVTRPVGTVTIMGKAIDTSGNESDQAAVIIVDLLGQDTANIVETINFDPLFTGTIVNSTVSGGDLVADVVDSFYGIDAQSFYGLDTDSFYEPTAYAAMSYTTYDVYITSALAGSLMTMQLSTQGDGVYVEYRNLGKGSFYGADADSFYGPDADSFYDPPGPWIPWPGQLVATNDYYNFRVSISSGIVQGKIFTMSITIDAPDMIEYLSDVSISAAGTIIPYTKSFTSIKTIQATLQANLSGAETVEIDKTTMLQPVIKAYNSAHTAVSGATADITLKGY